MRLSIVNMLFVVTAFFFTAFSQNCSSIIKVVDLNTQNTNNIFLSFVDPNYNFQDNSYMDDLNVLKSEPYLELSYKHDGVTFVPGEFSVELPLNIEYLKNDGTSVTYSQGMFISFNPNANTSHQDLHIITLENVVRIDISLASPLVYNSNNVSISTLIDMLTFKVCIHKDTYLDFDYNLITV